MTLELLPQIAGSCAVDGNVDDVLSAQIASAQFVHEAPADTEAGFVAGAACERIANDDGHDRFGRRRGGHAPR